MYIVVKIEGGNIETVSPFFQKENAWKQYFQLMKKHLMYQKEVCEVFQLQQAPKSQHQFDVLQEIYQDFIEKGPGDPEHEVYYCEAALTDAPDIEQVKWLAKSLLTTTQKKKLVGKKKIAKRKEAVPPVEKK